ncbi:MAG: hypothetical protein ACP5OR_06930 [Candidatus Dormibacteria bacterium]
MKQQPSDEDEDQAATSPDSALTRTNFSRAHQLAQTFNLAQQQSSPSPPLEGTDEVQVEPESPVEVVPPHPAFDWSILNSSPDRTNTVGIRAQDLPLEGNVPVDPPGQYYSHAARFDGSGNNRIINRVFAVAAGVIIGILAFMYMPAHIEAALAGALHGTPLSPSSPASSTTSHHTTRPPVHHRGAPAKTSHSPAATPLATATPEAVIPTLTPAPSAPAATPAPAAPPANTGPAPVSAPLLCAGGSTYATTCAWYIQLSPVSGTLITVQPGTSVTYTVSIRTITGVTFASGSSSGGATVSLKLTSPPPTFLVVVTPQGTNPGTFHLGITRD